MTDGKMQKQQQTTRVHWMKNNLGMQGFTDSKQIKTQTKKRGKEKHIRRLASRKEKVSEQTQRLKLMKRKESKQTILLYIAMK